jgi:Alw26I/Eco31I/Esp3I family type II restriction m6 adenine DNA methyltransferase
VSKTIKIWNSGQPKSTTSGEKDLITRVTGRFYTPELVGKQLVSAILQVVERENFPVSHIIEPFCGDGRLVCWLLEEMVARGIWQRQTLHIELWDCDEMALKSAVANVTQVGIKLKLPLDIQLRDCDTFERALKHLGQFSVVITNPPWEVLKPDSRELKTLTSQEKQVYVNWLKAKEQLLAKLYPLSQPKRKFSGWGTNLARCGAEVALQLTAPQGVCGLVSPASLLADQMTEKLRCWVLGEHIIYDLAYYPAEARLFSQVDQSSITLVASPGQSKQFSPSVTVYNRERQVQTHTVLSLSWEEMKALDMTLPIHFGGGQMQLLNKLLNLPTWRELEDSHCDALWAGRELDETGHKRYLGSEGDYLFLKGRMIQRFGIIEEPSQFVRRDGPVIPQSADSHRIAWRDVSRPSQKRRIQATLIPPGWVTGNSLNVAYFRNRDLEKLKALLAIMNSLVFEFQLRAYLATSHISLGTVRKVRIPLLTDRQLVERLSHLVNKCLAGCEKSRFEVEILVAQAYGLVLDDFKLLLSAFDKLTDGEINALLGETWTNLENLHKSKASNKSNAEPVAAPQKILQNEKKLPNHYSPSLSDLDLIMVRAIPPGGNWKNIPESIPSKRLEQIRSSCAAGQGSRSTYYGRLKADAPSYTISTCFNRPGNGCHIHYDYQGGQHRLISQREAARLQSFPDSFVFYGSRSAVNEQIGNAVPPFLAYQIALHLGDPGIFVDLFAGAGGLALGFTWAGWRPVVANDVMPAALETYAKNIHNCIVSGDIRKPEVFAQVVSAAQAAKRANPNVKMFVLGGPPCQGFSTAGKARSMSDERNSLFQNYRQIVEAIEPDGFVFENVMGLLNMENGRIFSLVHSALCSVADKLSVWKLDAENYGVPQRRKRVILVGRQGGSRDISPPPLVCDSTGGSLLGLPASITVSEAIADLPPLVPGQDGENLDYATSPATDYQRFMRGIISPMQYLERLRGQAGN